MLSPTQLQLSQSRGESSGGSAQRGRGSHHKQRYFNYRLFLLLSLISIVLLGGIYGLHTFQVQRTSKSFLDQARRAREEGDLSRAAAYLAKYLRYHPDDVEVGEERAILLKENAKTGKDYYRTMMAMENVIRKDSTRHQLRKEVVDVALKLGRWSDALVHLDLLRRETPKDGVLWYQSGLCQEAEGEYTEAMNDYRTSIKKSPEHLEAYVRLAFLLRTQFEQKEEAREVIDQMVTANAQMMDAYLSRAKYLITLEENDAAAADLAIALDKAPNDQDVVVLCARLISLGTDETHLQREQIKDRLEKLIEKNPEEEALYLARAGMAEKLGEKDGQINWLLRGLKAKPESLELATRLTANWLTEQRFDEAKEQIEQLRQRDESRRIAEYLHACLQMAQRRWKPALDEFRALVPKVAADSLFFADIQYRLGQIYVQLQDPALAIAAYRRVLEVDPNRDDVRMILATLLPDVGKLDDALALFRAQEESVESILGEAQLLVTKNLRETVSKRNWGETETLLKNGTMRFPTSPELPIMLARIYELGDRSEMAEKVLEEARGRLPEKTELWIAAIDLAIRNQQFDKARKLLAVAEKQFGESTQLQLTGILLSGAEHPEQMPAELKKFEETISSLPDSERIVYQRQLLRLHQRLGHSVEVARLLKIVGPESGNSVSGLMQMFDAAMLTGDEAEIKSAIARLKEFEGQDGYHWKYCQAFWDINQGAAGERERLVQAKQLLTEITRHHPSWSRSWEALARIAEIEGETSTAIAHYQEAFRRGWRSVLSSLRLAQLLLSTQQSEQADDVLRQLGQDVSEGLSGDYYMLASRAAAGVNDQERSLRLAQRAVELDADDFRKFLWLGTLQSATRDFAAAEVALKRAWELNPKQIAALQMLTQIMVQNGHRDEAKVIVEQAAQKRLDDVGFLLGLARSYEIVGDTDRAEAQYQNSLSLNPNSPATLMAVGEFYQRIGKTDQLESILQRMASDSVKTSAADRAWINRQKALVVARQGYRGLEEALKLLDQNLSSGKATLGDALLKAQLLAQSRSPQHHHEAVRLYQRVEKDRPLELADSLRLLQLLDQTEQQAEADRRWKKLAQDNPQNVQVVTGYVGRLLRKDSVGGEAESWQRKLEKLAPDQFQTQVLHAQLLVKQKKSAAAIESLEKYIQQAGDATEKTRRTNAAATFAMQTAEQTDGKQTKAEQEQWRQAAGRWFAGADAKENTTNVSYASYLIEQGKYDQALDIFAASLEDPTKQRYIVAAAINMLRQKSLSAEQAKRVDALVTKVADEPQASPWYRWQKASLREVQQRFDEAIPIYQEILAKDPNNLVGLNNLAWLLAYREQDRTQAEKLIRQAIGFHGPVSALRDTLGTVLILRGKASDAVPVLQELVDQDESAMHRYHLALACWKANDRNAARFHWQRAQELGFNEADLHPLERPLYQEFTAQLRP